MGSLSDAQETSCTRDSDPCPHPEGPIAISRSLLLLLWLLLRSGVGSPRFSCLSSQTRSSLLEVALCICNKIIHAPSTQSFVLNPLCRACFRHRRPSITKSGHRRPAASIPILPADEGNALEGVTGPPSKGQRLRETLSPTTPNSPTLVPLYSSIRFFSTSPREPRTR